jgi:hypothetical protein
MTGIAIVSQPCGAGLNVFYETRNDSIVVACKYHARAQARTTISTSGRAEARTMDLLTNRWNYHQYHSQSSSKDYCSATQ